MKTVAIIEVRMGSTRLPGKALINVVGKPIIEHVVNRIQLCKKIDEIVIATTVNSLDNAIEKLAKQIGVFCFRGSEEDVLLRVVNASKCINADLVVLSGGDSPFFDWRLADALIEKYCEKPSYDLVTNCLELTYPLGVYTYVVSSKILNEIEALTVTPNQREDTLRYVFENDDQYKIFNLKAPEHLKRPDYRLTIDYQEDVELMKKLYEDIYLNKTDFTIQDVIAYLDKNHEIAEINKHCVQISAPHIDVN